MPLFRRFPGAKPEFKHTTNRPSSDRLADLETAFGELSDAVNRVDTKVGKLTARTGNLEGRDQEQQEWNAECQRRVQPQASISERVCITCRRTYPDGPSWFPGCLEQPGKDQAAEIRRQECAYCRGAGR